MLNQAPTEEQLLTEQSEQHDTASVTPSARTSTGISNSMTSSYSLKTSASGTTLAPSSLSGSYTTKTNKSSLKKSPTKRYTPSKTAKDFSNYPGYNKLRLDSAVSPKHSPRSTASATDKVSILFRLLSSNIPKSLKLLKCDTPPAF